MHSEVTRQPLVAVKLRKWMRARAKESEANFGLLIVSVLAAGCAHTLYSHSSHSYALTQRKRQIEWR
jgi:hypothetical protein